MVVMTWPVLRMWLKIQLLNEGSMGVGLRMYLLTGVSLGVGNSGLV